MSHRRRKKRSQKRRMSYFCARNQSRSHMGRRRSWRERRRIWSPPWERKDPDRTL
jgi:hypothetical protein